MTSGMIDTLLEFHVHQVRSTFGKVTAACANVMRTGEPASPYDFYPDPETGGRPRQTAAEQVNLLRKARENEDAAKKRKIIRTKR